jgi:Holliday junction resolvasome RuvABC endonuclease subunit
MKRLIAIDGSTTKTGVAIFNIDKHKLQTLKVLCPDNIEKPLTKKAKDSLTKKQITDKQKEIHRKNTDYRISEMIKQLNKIFDKNKPEVIIMEDTYGSKDMYAYKKLCQLQGLVLSYCLINNITFILKMPQSWRKDLGFEIIKNGQQNTREEYKSMSINHIKDKYGIDVSDDEADAICIGESYFVREGADYESEEY